MTVASSQLVVGSIGSATVTTIFTGPTGKRTIIKSIWVRNAGAAGAVAFTVTPAGGGAATFNIWCAATSTSGDSQHAEPWIVLNPGDTLKIGYPTASGGWHVISGTELTL